MSSDTDFSDFTARLRQFIDSAGESVLAASTRLAPAAMEREFERLALELFSLQFEHNQPYRRFCERRGAHPGTVTQSALIPAIPAAAFKELELSCLAKDKRTKLFLSSGTTEQRPSRHFHSPETLGIYQSSLLPWFEVHLVPERRLAVGDWRLAILTPSPAEASHSSLVYMFEAIRRKAGCPTSAFLGRVAEDGSWSLDFGATTETLRQASQTDLPLILLGTAFSFVQLLDWLTEEHIQFELPPGSRAMETGGYKGRSRALPKAELHTLITSRLGIPTDHIVCEYGMSELSSQAYDLSIGGGQKANLRRSFQFPPWARAQIVSPETGREVAEGETGLIRVFDLANVSSVMAVQTEDLGIRRGEGFELIGRARLAEPRGCSLMVSSS